MAQINTQAIFNEIPCPWRWYDTPLKRNNKKRQCKFDEEYKLLTFRHALLPFTIVKDFSANAITTWKLIAENGSEISLNVNLIEKKNILSKDYLIYKGDRIGIMLDCGYYESEISDGVSTWYSEKFYVTSSGYCENIAINPEFKTDLTGWSISGFGGIGWDNDGVLMIVNAFGKALTQTVSDNIEVRVGFKITGWNGLGTATLQVGASNTFNINGDGEYYYEANTENNGIINFIFTEDWGGRVEWCYIQILSDNFHPCSIVMEWGSTCDFGEFYYRSDFRNRFIFDQLAQLGEHKWRTIEEGTNDGNGTFTPQSRKRQKVYHLETGAVPEYIVDALVEMSLHPLKYIYIPNCFGYAEIKEVKVTPKSVLDNCYYNCEIDFVIGEMIETGCCDNLEDCIQACYDAFPEMPSVGETGKYYLSTNGTLKYVDVSSVIDVPCETGLVRHDADDATNIPPYWLWDANSNSWLDLPQIWDIDQAIGSDDVRVFCLIAPGTVGQLEMSTDGVTYNPVSGALLNDVDWLSTGFLLVGLGDLPSGSATFYFRINSYNDTCSFGLSEPLSYTVFCTIVCTANGYFKVSRNYNSGGDYITIHALWCNGVNVLGSPVIVDLTTPTYSLGQDGVTLYLDNITDTINALLPPGYKVYEDMRIITHPCDETFHFVLSNLFTFTSGGGGTVTYDYDYSNDNGYEIDHVIRGGYDCE